MIDPFDLSLIDDPEERFNIEVCAQYFRIDKLPQVRHVPARTSIYVLALVPPIMFPIMARPIFWRSETVMIAIHAIAARKDIGEPEIRIRAGYDREQNVLILADKDGE